MSAELHRARVRVDRHVVRFDAKALLEVQLALVSGLRSDGRARQRRRPSRSHAGSGPGRHVFVDRKDRQTNYDLCSRESSDRLHSCELLR